MRLRQIEVDELQEAIKSALATKADKESAREQYRQGQALRAAARELGLSDHELQAALRQVRKTRERRLKQIRRIRTIRLAIAVALLLSIISLTVIIIRSFSREVRPATRRVLMMEGEGFAPAYYNVDVETGSNSISQNRGVDVTNRADTYNEIFPMEVKVDY